MTYGTEHSISKIEAKAWTKEHGARLPRPGQLVRLVRSNFARSQGINDMVLFRRNGQWIICPVID